MTLIITAGDDDDDEEEENNADHNSDPNLPIHWKVKEIIFEVNG